MVRAYVSVGSNVDPEHHIRAALRELKERFGPLEVSPVYESRAYGFEGHNFLNLVAAFATEEPPEAVDRALKAVEAAHGRERSGTRFSDRTLDLDLILYGDAVLTRGRLRVPRPEVLEHAHVLRPLADIAAGERHPVEGHRYGDLWARFEARDQELWPVEVRLDDGG